MRDDYPPDVVLALVAAVALLGIALSPLFVLLW